MRRVAPLGIDDMTRYVEQNITTGFAAERQVPAALDATLARLADTTIAPQQETSA